MWDCLKEKLNKSGRKWEESEKFLPYRAAELFCEQCGKSVGIHDIVITNLETLMYCNECVKPYIKQTPVDIKMAIIIKDRGNSVDVKYEDNYYKELIVNKVCYFNKKGRYIKIKGKRYYI